ncbi:MAG: fibronectin type III domain-containing protein, partial [Thaumarchaeota archaeon]|nr:fibronectin type III domain-containing protein [Nitrososphaerota archaeon]
IDMIGKHMLVLIASATILFSVIPAYAEVTSLSTSAPFYKGGSKIFFTGSTADTDPSNITIIVFDPTDKFITLLSGIADSTHHFQVSLDTSDSSYSQQFTLKGTYNATAFVATKENGKTASFIFSPDGSPVVPSPPLSLTASVPSSTEIDISWSAPKSTGGTMLSGYKVDRSADNGATWITVAPNVINTVTSYPDTGLASGTIYLYRVVAINSAGASDPSNIVTASTLTSVQSTTSSTTGSQDNSSSLSLDELIKQRLENAKRLQDILNGHTSQSSGGTQQSNTQQSINLTESMSVDDISSSLPSTSYDNTTKSTSLIPANLNNVIYPAIALVGVGIVVFILYQRKKLMLSMPRIKKESPPAHTPQVDAPSEKEDEDYALAILKNRLAKGEITLEQFKEIKDELSEP